MNIILVDLGGTNTRIARAAKLNKPELVSEPIRRKNTHNYADDLAFIINTAKELSNNEHIDAIGIGVPGRVNQNKTGIVASNNLPEWANRNFVQDMAEALHCPVYMDNDAVAASLGEAYYSNTKSDFHYLIWGTGISGVSIEHDNNNVTTAYIRPIYQHIFDPWEESCGGAALARRYNKPGEELTTGEWQEANAIFADFLRQYVAAGCFRKGFGADDGGIPKGTGKPWRSRRI